MAACLGLLVLGAPRSPLDRPNVVMLFVDDLGYGDVGFNGHPTTATPNIDSLAWTGKVLTSWYSACPVCSCSRASLLTGRQWTRMGIPAVFNAVGNVGLPLNETTVATELKKGGYRTGVVGKWHLGQRAAYLPAGRGFDEYLGIPYSDDMGHGRRSPCDSPATATSPAMLPAISAAGATTPMPDTPAPATSGAGASAHPLISATGAIPVSVSPTEGGAGAVHKSAAAPPLTNILRPSQPLANIFRPSPPRENILRPYIDAGMATEPSPQELEDPAGKHLPLLRQKNGKTVVVEQPVDFTTLGAKYAHFAETFIFENAASPFFLYMPFSHVHTTEADQPEKQYCGCEHKDQTRRGAFGDALAEADAIVGRIMAAIDASGVRSNTLVLFTGDNGPWLAQGTSGGSPGLLSGTYSGYWNVGKGSTWEGGIREAGFAHWHGVIPPATRSAEIISSMDLLPTVLDLAQLPLPPDRAIDGKSARDLLLSPNGKSQHDVLFFYGGANGQTTPSAARYGPYKAHWATGPGLGGCKIEPSAPAGCPVIRYRGGPLLFQIEHDPSEAYPISANESTHDDPDIAAVLCKLQTAYENEVATLGRYSSPPAPDGPGEGPGRYGVCCDRKRSCYCVGDAAEVAAA